MDVVSYISQKQSKAFRYKQYNEIDFSIFSTIAYNKFEVLNPKRHYTINKLNNTEQLTSSLPNKENQDNLLAALKKNKKFNKLKISDIRSNISLTETMQFFALTIKLSIKVIAIVFRGTDGSIVGWKENLNMAYINPVPAQQEALDYFYKIKQKYRHKKFVLIGHSKGGNLAEYVYLKSKDKSILDVYNFDGPGFNDESLYEGIDKTKIHKYIPEESLVGVLFNKDEKIIVKANKEKFKQHSIFNWEINGNSFIKSNKQSKFSRIFEKTFNSWYKKLNPDNFKNIIEQAIEILHIEIDQKVSDISISMGTVIVGLLKPSRREIRGAAFDLFIKYQKAKSEVEKEIDESNIIDVN